MWINSVKKRIQNFTSGVSDDATGALHRKDRVSQSAPDAGHAVGSYVRSVVAVKA